MISKYCIIAYFQEVFYFMSWLKREKFPLFFLETGDIFTINRQNNLLYGICTYTIATCVSATHVHFPFMHNYLHVTSYYELIVAYIELLFGL